MQSAMKPSYSARATGASDKHRIFFLVVAGTVLLIAVLAVFCSAFIVAPNVEVALECDHGTAALLEVPSTLMAFVLGWLGCYMLKHRRGIAQKMSCAVARCSGEFDCMCSSSATIILDITSFGHRCQRRADVVIVWSRNQIEKSGLIIMAGVLLSTCTFLAFARAFTAIPDVEWTGGDGDANESPQCMRFFTAGWICILSFKLRRELAGLLGYSSLLQPF